MNLLPKRAKYRVDMPFQESPDAIAIKGVGILEKLTPEPTEPCQPPHAVYRANGERLDCGVGVMSIRGFGTILMCMAIACFGFVLALVLKLAGVGLASELEARFLWSGAAALLVVSAVFFLGFIQGLNMEAPPFRDFFFRFSRRTGRLYEWTPDKIWSAKFDELVPLHERVSAGTIVNGNFYLADLDRERGVVRRLYPLAPLTLSSPDGSQLHYEYLRRYMAGEFDRMPTVQQAVPPVRGYVGIARGFAPARWGRELHDKLGPRALPLRWLVTIMAGVLLGLPWLTATLADMRLPLPRWSDIDEQEFRDGAPRAEANAPLAQDAGELPPEFNPPPAPWEGPFYAPVMAVGSLLWLTVVAAPIYIIWSL